MQTPENIPLSVVEIKSPAWVDEIRSAVWVDEIRSAVRGVQTSSRIRTCSKSLKLGYFQIIYILLTDRSLSQISFPISYGFFLGIQRFRPSFANVYFY